MGEFSVAERDLLLQRKAEMWQERASWEPHWRELGRRILPRSGRFLTTDRNVGGASKWNDIYDNTATLALRVLTSGLRSGMANPSAPWLRLATPDIDLNRRGPVREWLADCTQLMLRVFAKSNMYRSMDSTYDQHGVYGTSAKMVTDSFQNIIQLNQLEVGEYAIATDYDGNVNAIYRAFEKPVAALVREFGYDNCSLSVRNLYDRGTLGAWIPVIHVIEPRDDRDYRIKDAKNKPWKSCYFEPGSNEGKYLRESGFDAFPALVSRWSTRGNDIYGESPAMLALGDVNQLQLEQLRKAQAIDFMTKPPLQTPAGMKGSEVNILPGQSTVVPSGGGEIKSLFNVLLNLDHLGRDIVDVRERINNAFFVNSFLTFAKLEGVQPRNVAEISARDVEKLLVLGPIVERLTNEEFTPLVEMTFARMVQTGILPPPPPDLHGAELQVEFVGPLAQAQRAVGTGAVDRFVGNLGMIAQYKPDILDKFDGDEWADAYSDMLGVDPTLIVSDDKVALIRKTRAEQQQRVQQMQMANAAADTANKLGNAPTTQGRNALAELAGQ